MAQLKLAAGGFGIGGKNDITNNTTRNKIPIMLTARPARPSENGLSRSGCPLILRRATQANETMYDVMRATDPIERITLKAIADPMAIQCRMHAMMVVTMTALAGISNLGGT